jgi:hypothetical protein
MAVPHGKITSLLFKNIWHLPEVNNFYLVDKNSKVVENILDSQSFGLTRRQRNQYAEWPSAMAYNLSSRNAHLVHQNY